MNESRISTVIGRAVPVTGDDIDTDRILPARYMKEITFGRMGEYPFFDERFTADGREKAHVFNDRQFQGASLLLANANFGCGSSREHAPQALSRWGIRAIVAESYGEIFAGNCLMLGMAAVVAEKNSVASLQALARQNPQAEFRLDLAAMTITAGDLRFAVSMPESARRTLVDGTWDTLGMLLANAGRAKELGERLRR